MNLGVYELIYQAGQIPKLGDPFCTYNYSDSKLSQYRELFAFKNFCTHEVWGGHDLSGLFSPLFFQKTGIDGQIFKSFILNNPGYQLYLFHPYPLELSLQNSFLDLAELEHPGITELLSKIWYELYQDDLPLLNLPENQNICCHCNYMVGTKKFWSAYSTYTNSFMELLHKDADLMMSRLTPYSLSNSQDSSLPIAVFAYERSLSHFIKKFISPDKVINFAYHQSNWIPKELFPLESQLIKGLLDACNLSSINGKFSVNENKLIATNAYYFLRKLLRPR